MKQLGVLLFDDFELLDVYGPLEMFGLQRDAIAITLLAERAGPIKSAAGPASVAERSLAETAGEAFDILLVPGGLGTRREVGSPVLMDWLRETGAKAGLLTSVCTGAALLAKAGLLDGKKATTNKKAWQWATAQGPLVDWQAKARWVVDGTTWTSSGVAAGTDMALALIAALLGTETAQATADHAEYTWEKDAGNDPFAALYGLA